MDPTTREYAQQQDEQDDLRHLRDLFVIPSKADLSRPTLTPVASEPGSNEECMYFCGNSLGLQTTLARKYHDQYLRTWAQKGVHGHFKSIKDSNLTAWLEGDADLQPDMAALVGASPSEVILMQTLTANLHLMMASFYCPTKDRYKIILEGKAFPSDHYAVESQIQHHGFDVASSMVLIEPPSKSSPLIPTEHILATIDAHASQTALLLLPGIQYYTGQFLDMKRITAHAKARGIVVGWDLAHAVGNVPVELHNWDVDFAVWCTYKYMNAGPGSMGGCFVHERHGRVQPRGDETSTNGNSLHRFAFRPRLTGWWGASKAARFEMNNRFEPIPGAAGFQLSNPSASDIACLRATLDVFKQTSIRALRAKSLRLTRYLEERLDGLSAEQGKSLAGGKCFEIITPRDPESRGAQLSVLLRSGLLDSIMETLEAEGVVLDERRPDVIRVAPAPLYNNYTDVFNFIEVFRRACEKAVGGKKANGHA